MSSRLTDEVGQSARGRGQGLSRGIAAALLCGYVLASGCAARGVPPGDATASAREYIVQHREALEQEIQAGSGEHLYQLSIIANCRNLPQFNRTLHRRHAEIFPVPPPSNEQVADDVLAVMRSDRALVCRDLELDRKRPFAAGTRHVESVERR